MTQDTSNSAPVHKGYELFQRMRHAYRLAQTNPDEGRPRVNELLKVALEQNKDRYGDWNEAKRVVNAVDPQKVRFENGDTAARRVYGYPCHVIKYMDATGERIANEFISIFHPNGKCYQRWIIRNGNVVF